MIRGTARFVALVSTVAVVISGCGGGAPQQSEGAQGQAAIAVTRSEVATHLMPLARAVADYANTPPGTDMNDMNSAFVDSLKTRLSVIDAEEADWRSFIDSIDYGATDITELRQAIGAYNDGLDKWQVAQRRGLTNAEACIAKGLTQLDLATCMLQSYGIEDEQQALDAYTTPLKALLNILGVEAN